MTIFEFENGDDDFKVLSKTMQCAISMAVCTVLSFFFVLLLQLPIIAAPAGILAIPVFMLEPLLGITTDYRGEGNADIEIIFFFDIKNTSCMGNFLLLLLYYFQPSGTDLSSRFLEIHKEKIFNSIRIITNLHNDVVSFFLVLYGR